MISIFDSKPSAIMPLGNGAYYYNYNIRELVAEGDEPAGWQCDTVKLWGAPEYGNIVRAVIRNEYDANAEFDLVNSYNAACAGITEGDKAKADTAAYIAFIGRVSAIKVMVKKDLSDGLAD